VALLLALSAAAAPAGPAHLEAQSLERVEELTREGRMQAARTELLAWWEASGASRPAREDLQRGLWLRGLLTLDPAQAELDYTRLVVEHPGSRFTDLALHRLGQAAVARGDLPAARRHYAVLVRDHPASSVRGEVRRWLEENPASGDPAPTPPTESGSGPYAVQLGAFQDGQRARDLAERVRAAGFEARLVTTSPAALVRVRVGRFAAADGATGLHDRLRSAGFDAIVVADAGSELAAGGG
jgi:hypothetical protein